MGRREGEEEGGGGGSRWRDKEITTGSWVVRNSTRVGRQGEGNVIRGAVGLDLSRSGSHNPHPISLAPSDKDGEKARRAIRTPHGIHRWLSSSLSL